MKMSTRRWAILLCVIALVGFGLLMVQATRPSARRTSPPPPIAEESPELKPITTMPATPRHPRHPVEEVEVPEMSDPAPMGPTLIVRAEADDSPVPTYRVSGLLANGRLTELATVESDDGQWCPPAQRLEGVVSLRIEAEGFLPAECAVRDESKLKVALSRGGSLEVRVLRPSGQPVPAAKVWLPGRCGTSDASGTCRFEAIPFEYPVTVAASSGPCLVISDPPVELTPSCPERTVELIFEEKLSLFVTVSKESGEPLKGAWVFLEKREGATEPIRRMRTDDNGQCRYAGLAPGEYLLLATATGHESQVRSPLLLDARETRVDLRLTPERRRTLAGRVVDRRGKPISSVHVSLRSGSSTRSVAEATTDESGSFRLENVVPKCRTSFGRLGPLMRTSALTIRLSKSGWPTAHYENVDCDGRREYVYGPTLMLTGVLDSGSGAPVSEYGLRFEFGDGGVLRWGSGQNPSPNFTWRGVPLVPGRLVVLSNRAKVIVPVEPTGDSVDLGRILLTPGGGLDLVLRIPEGVRQPGRGLVSLVSDGTPKAVIRRSTNLTRLQTGLDIPPGSYSVRILMNGFLVEGFSAEIRAGERTSTAADLVPLHSLRVITLMEGRPAPGITLTLRADGVSEALLAERAVGWIDDQGRVEPPAVTGWEEEGMTGQDGTWTFRRLPEGKYVVGVSGTDVPAREVTVEVGATRICCAVLELSD